MGGHHHITHRRAPAHHAHPPAPAHIQPPTPLVKQLVDAVSYVQDMEIELQKAKADWELFAQTATLAYQWAWKQQRDVLAKVEANQKARREAEVAEIMFAIN